MENLLHIVKYICLQGVQLNNHFLSPQLNRGLEIDENAERRANSRSPDSNGNSKTNSEKTTAVRKVDTLVVSIFKGGSNVTRQRVFEGEAVLVS